MGDQIKVPKIVHAKDSIVLLNHQNIIIKDMKFTTKSSHVPLASGRGGRCIVKDASFARCFAIFLNIVKKSER